MVTWVSREVGILKVLFTSDEHGWMDGWMDNMECINIYLDRMTLGSGLGFGIEMGIGLILIAEFHLQRSIRCKERQRETEKVSLTCNVFSMRLGRFTRLIMFFEFFWYQESIHQEKKKAFPSASFLTPLA